MDAYVLRTGDQRRRIQMPEVGPPAWRPYRVRTPPEVLADSEAGAFGIAATFSGCKRGFPALQPGGEPGLGLPAPYVTRSFVRRLCNPKNKPTHYPTKI